MFRGCILYNALSYFIIHTLVAPILNNHICNIFHTWKLVWQGVTRCYKQNCLNIYDCTTLSALYEISLEVYSAFCCRYGFVRFSKKEDTTYARDRCNEAKLDNSVIIVDYENSHNMKGWIPRRLGMSCLMLRGLEILLKLTS